MGIGDQQPHFIGGNVTPPKNDCDVASPPKMILFLGAFIVRACGVNARILLFPAAISEDRLQYPCVLRVFKAW